MQELDLTELEGEGCQAICPTDFVRLRLSPGWECKEETIHYLQLAYRGAFEATGSPAIRTGL